MSLLVPRAQSHPPPAGPPSNLAWVRRGISYLQLHSPGRQYAPPGSAARVGYTPHLGYALVPGPPIADPTTWPALVQAFEARAHAEGLRVAFCGVSDFGRDFFGRQGYHCLKVGDEAIVELPGVTLAGARWRECRVAINRARRRGLCFEWIGPGDRAALAGELQAVSGAWLAGKPVPEFTFSLGGFTSLFDPHTRLAVARDASGGIVAFATWAPVPLRQGWMLDVMRFKPGVMAGLMDFLVAQSLLGLRDRGFATASLGGVPLSNVGRSPGGLLRWALDRAYAWTRFPYAPRSLLHYKAKFNPVWEPLYLVSEPGGHLPLALLALLSASMPKLTPLHLLRGVAKSLAGMVRG